MTEKLNNRPKPIVLIILDGWGYREQSDANAIALANTPHWNYLWDHYPHTLISGSGHCVGLPDGQMGNSEVGHLTMGAGRIIYQDLTRIDSAIENGDFFKNTVLINAINKATNHNKKIHIMTLLSDGGVHSFDSHTRAIVDLAAAQNASQVFIHAFLDGRDTPPRSAESFLMDLEKHCETKRCGKIATIVGRYYAMDRDKRWDRVQKAYDLLTEGKAEIVAKNVKEAIKKIYDEGFNDEFAPPTLISTSNFHSIDDGDVIIFMNFRADRARQITRAFIDPHFKEFTRNRKVDLGEFVSLTEYDKTLPTTIAFPPEALTNILASYLSHHGFKQLRIAETEKYAHITFFFNGGIETPFPQEDRILIPSPKVATYDLKPEMSAYELTETLVQQIESNQYDLIICNYANPDMVGHTGNLKATISAIETIDYCLGQILQALEKVNGEALITSDHGNAEIMFDNNTNQPHTAHTCELIPFIYVGRQAEVTKAQGQLSDISPTILYLMGLPQPQEMTGHSLVKIKNLASEKVKKSNQNTILRQ